MEKVNRADDLISVEMKYKNERSALVDDESRDEPVDMPKSLAKEKPVDTISLSAASNFNPQSRQGTRLLNNLHTPGNASIISSGVKKLTDTVRKSF
jgi:hypothetical protein